MTSAGSVALPRRALVHPSGPLLVVSGLTALAFVLRLTGLQESLFGDELYTLAVSDQPHLSDLVPAMKLTENNPPLFYVLAWGAGKLGDPTVLIRLPSLILGTATVPVIYLLGRRALGSLAGLIGAALFALSPFAVFFGNEARAYALLMFLVALSTLLLLVALEERRTRWWVAYAACAALIVYSHYTGIPVVGAQAAWAVWAHRERLRELSLAYAAVGLAALAWLPFFLDQDTPPLAGFRALGAAPFSLETCARELVTALVGHPYLDLSDVPGAVALVLLGLAGLLALFGGARALGRRAAASPALLLLAAVAAAAPLAAGLYSIFGTDIFYARNLSASLPALFLVLGALLASLPGRVLALALALGAAGLCAGLVKALDADQNRPPFRDAARVIDENGRAGDPVVDLTFGSIDNPLGRILSVHFDRPHDVFMPGEADRQAWPRAERGATVFLVIPQVGELAGVPARSGPGRRFVLRSHEIFPGFTPVGVFAYTREGQGAP